MFNLHRLGIQCSFDDFQELRNEMSHGPCRNKSQGETSGSIKELFENKTYENINMMSALGYVYH
jgi:hypothetical protein